MKHLDYVISKTSSTRREDGAYDYFMVHLALILPTGDIELTQGMIVARDFLFDLINEHHIQLYTVKTTKQNKITACLPVFIEYCHLKVFSSSLEWDNLGELDTFSVEVSQ